MKETHLQVFMTSPKLGRFIVGTIWQNQGCISVLCPD
jgi:hypothetical protein